MHCSCKQDIWGVGGHFCASQIMPFRQPHRCSTLGAADLLCTQWRWALKDAWTLKHLFSTISKLNQSQIWQCHTVTKHRFFCLCVIVYVLKHFLKKEMGLLMCIHDKRPKIGDLNAFNSAWESRNRWMYASSRRRKKKIYQYGLNFQDECIWFL